MFVESGTTTEWLVPEEAHGVGEVASRGDTVRTCEDYSGSVATRIRELAVGYRTIDEHRQTLLVLSVSFEGNSVFSSASCHRLTDNLRFQCHTVFAHYFHFCP